MRNEKWKISLLDDANKKGNRHRPFPFYLFANAGVGQTGMSVLLYAGAGLPPVIGGKIGFSGLAEGSFN
jgi:hypothetical protein